MPCVSPVAGLTKQNNHIRRSSVSLTLAIPCFLAVAGHKKQHNPIRRSPAARIKTILFAGRRPDNFIIILFAGRRLHETRQARSPVAGLTKQNNPFRRTPASSRRRLIALRTWELFLLEKPPVRLYGLDIDFVPSLFK